MRPRILPLLIAAALAAFTLPTFAADEKVGADQQLVLDAAHGNHGEVKAGNLAKTNASDASVKQFAEMMVTDHTKAGIELESAAKASNLTYPIDTDADHKAMLDKLSKLKAKEFDKQYMDDMVAGHKKMEDLLQKISKDAQSEHLKNWAARTLPAVQAHLKRAQEIKSALK
jgi:putative membrane protein